MAGVIISENAPVLPRRRSGNDLSPAGIDVRDDAEVGQFIDGGSGCAEILRIRPFRRQHLRRLHRMSRSEQRRDTLLLRIFNDRFEAMTAFVGHRSPMDDEPTVDDVEQNTPESRPVHRRSL